MKKDGNLDRGFPSLSFQKTFHFLLTSCSFHDTISKVLFIHSSLEFPSHADWCMDCHSPLKSTWSIYIFYEKRNHLDVWT